MRAWNKKHKPKFATKTKITKFYGITTFSYAVMKPKYRFYNFVTLKIEKGIKRKMLLTNKYRGW